jgi:uncharacterized protein (TIGR02996 family)
MLDEAAFIHTICSSPDDDGPRLVYADWLEERGDCARSEFIRCQVALAFWANNKSIFRAGSSSVGRISMTRWSTWPGTFSAKNGQASRSRWLAGSESAHTAGSHSSSWSPIFIRLVR